VSSGNYVDADGVLFVAHGGGAPVMLGASSSSSSTSTAASDGIAALATASPAASNDPPTQPAAASKSVAVAGVSQPATLHVMYNQDQPTAQDSPAAGPIDLILETGSAPTAKTAKKSDSIGDLARSLLG
jgi:hypothetical protein